MVVAGAIIGVGIFVNPSNVARLLPDPGWTLLAWAAGGAIAMIGGFLYAELGSRLPLVGGQYVYLSRAWGPFVGFLYGFALLFVINSGGMAAVASVLASYVDASFVPLGRWGRLALAAGALAAPRRDQRPRRPARQADQQRCSWRSSSPASRRSWRSPRCGRGRRRPTSPRRRPTAPSRSPSSSPRWCRCSSPTAAGRTAAASPPRSATRRGRWRAPTSWASPLIVAVYLGLNLLYLRALSPAEVAGSAALAADVARSARRRGGGALRRGAHRRLLPRLPGGDDDDRAAPLLRDGSATGSFFAPRRRAASALRHAGLTLRLQAAVAIAAARLADLRPAALLRRLLRLALLRSRGGGALRPAPARRRPARSLPRAGAPGDDRAFSPSPPR